MTPDRTVPGGTIRVLLVEDDPDDYVLTRDLLREAGGFELHWEATYGGALGAVRARTPDVVLVDYRLGARSGLDLLAELLALGCEAPVLVLTGQGDREVDLAAMQAGAADYLPKGELSPALLERSVRHAIERTRAREAVAFLASLVASSSEAITGEAPDGTLMSWNAGAEQLYGYTAREAVGRNVSFLVPPDRADELPEILERIRRGERISQFETVRRRKDGTSVDVSLTLSPVLGAGGRVTGASVIARDISERKRAEEALRRAEWLAGVGAATLTLRHEINNPLASMLADATLLEMEGNSPEEEREMVRSMVRQARRVGEVVRSLSEMKEPPATTCLDGKAVIIDLSR